MEQDYEKADICFAAAAKRGDQYSQDWFKQPVGQPATASAKDFWTDDFKALEKQVDNAGQIADEAAEREYRSSVDND